MTENKEKKQRVQTRLEPSLRDKAKKIGEGNVTDGIRKALIKYKLKRVKK